MTNDRNHGRPTPGLLFCTPQLARLGANQSWTKWNHTSQWHRRNCLGERNATLGRATGLGENEKVCRTSQLNEGKGPHPSPTE